MRRAYSCNWRIALSSAPLVYLEQVLTTSTRYQFEGLTPGQTYIVQVNAAGTAGETSYSNPVASMMVI
ncbi:MAG: fibronectin type III domain-containing protein [Chthoniobacterales bacterium]